MILFSFNHPTGTFNYVWHGFTFDNWLHWNAVLGIQRRRRSSRSRSRCIATLVATALGTLIALAIVRHRFRGRGATNIVDLPADVDARDRAGASLLTLFLNDQNAIQLGFWTIFIAHVDVHHQLRGRAR